MEIGTDHTEVVGDFKNLEVEKSYAATVKQEISIEAGERIILTTGKSSFVMNADGTIHLHGVKIFQTGADIIELQSDIVKVN